MLSEEQKARQRRLEMKQAPKYRKRRFLDALAETFDVDAACAAAGLCWRDMCALRDEDPDFAADWERVIQGGYERIEIMLLRLAGAAAKSESEADLGLARELLKLRAPARRPRRSGGGAPKPDREARLASIIRKIRKMRPTASKKDDRNETDPPVGPVAADAAGPAGGG